jgi:hypothetical protein
MNGILWEYFLCATPIDSHRSLHEYKFSLQSTMQFLLLTLWWWRSELFAELPRCKQQVQVGFGFPLETCIGRIGFSVLSTVFTISWEENWLQSKIWFGSLMVAFTRCPRLTERWLEINWVFVRTSLNIGGAGLYLIGCRRSTGSPFFSQSDFQEIGGSCVFLYTLQAYIIRCNIETI